MVDLMVAMEDMEMDSMEGKNQFLILFLNCVTQNCYYQLL